MGIRTVCFLLAVLFIAVLHWTIAGWVMVGGAVLLPYFAVVMANVSRSRFSAPLGPVTPSHRAVEGTDPPRPEDGSPARAGPVTATAPPAREPGRPPRRRADPPRLRCSAKGCRADAAYGLLWNNPKLHTPDRRKTWLACEQHRESLGAFLSVRGFLRDTVPVGELDERD